MDILEAVLGSVSTVTDGKISVLGSIVCVVSFGWTGVAGGVDVTSWAFTGVAVVGDVTDNLRKTRWAIICIDIYYYTLLYQMYQASNWREFKNFAFLKITYR